MKKLSDFIPGKFYDVQDWSDDRDMWEHHIYFCLNSDAKLLDIGVPGTYGNWEANFLQMTTSKIIWTFNEETPNFKRMLKRASAWDKEPTIDGSTNNLREATIKLTFENYLKYR
jgi:hypothetical protein